MILYYAPLYMRGVGLSSVQVGALGSLTLAFSLLFQLVAAPITNRFGRKRTTLIGDLISWTAPMLVWAFSRNFETFVLAAVLSASGRIVAVSWSLLVIEDVEAGKRARVFAVLNLIVAGCGLLTPLVGYFIGLYGVVPVLRVFYALGAVGMTVMFFWRHSITQETQLGQAAIAQHRALNPWQSLRHTVQQVAGLRSHKGLGSVMVFYVLTIFTEQMSLFQILFLGETLRFSAAALSLVPVTAALITGLMYALSRRLSGQPAERALVLARIIGLAGAVMLLFIPPANLPLMLLTVSVLGAATFLTQTYRDTLLFSRLPPDGSADLLSAVQTLCLLCSIPAAALAGAIFSVQPHALFAIIAGLNLGLLLLALGLARRKG